MTEPQDTAVDVAGHLPLPQALIVIDAIGRRLLPGLSKVALADESGRARVRAILGNAADCRTGTLGVRTIRLALSAADPAADSPPESFIRGHIIAAGLPIPEVNPRICGSTGRSYFPDLLYRRERLLIEVDGRLKYTDDMTSVYAEKIRQDDLAAAGWRVVRWSAADVLGSPHGCLAELHEVLRTRNLLA